MADTVTVTSKGQITIPAEIRKQLKLSKSESKLHIRFDPFTSSVVLCKPMSLEEISALASSFISKGTEPLVDAKKFYEENRARTLVNE